MKQILIFLIFLPLLGCNNLIENKQTSINFNCPRVFFSSEDRIFIDNSISLDDIGIKAEFNNFAINKQCMEQENIAIIPVDILIEVKPISNLEESSLTVPIYVTLLDANDKVLEVQYFSVLGSINRNSETNDLIETDITGRLKVVTKYLNTSQLVIGFMLNKEKKNLLN